MAPAYVPIDPNHHVHKGPGNVLEFSPEAVDITLLDRRGKAVWRQLRRSAQEPLRWEGADQSGQKVETGHYILKILYPDMPPVYVPFVVM